MQHDPPRQRLRLGLGTAVREMVAQSMEGLSHCPSLASVNFQKKRIEEVSKKDTHENFQKFHAITNLHLYTCVSWLCVFLRSQ